MSHHRRRKPSKRPPSDANAARQGDRLQKVLAAAGLGSRRDCEELIVAGRVEIDRKTVTELGSRVDPLRQEIRVDGVLLPQPRRVHYMLNKPPGVVCTNDDPSGRIRAIDLVRSGERLFTVGRLDRSSEGMILVTNDGELANQLTHPRYGVEKRYLVRVVGSPNPVILEKLRRGIRLAEGIARVSDIRVRKRTSKFTDMEIVLQEGRNREIRRILARIGHKVVRLKRIAIGPLRLGELPSGESRVLSRDEIRVLQDAARDSRQNNRRKRKGKEGEEPAGQSPETKRSGKPPFGKPSQSGKPSSGKPPFGKSSQSGKPSSGKPPFGKPAPPGKWPRSPDKTPPPIPLELDEVEVTETPLDLPPGAIIGDDDWGPAPSEFQGQPGRKRRRS